MASQALSANYCSGLAPDQRLARSLGWFAIGLGATETRRMDTACSATSRTTARRSCSNRSSVRSTEQLCGRDAHTRPY
jgi:hypothetical protein